MTRCYSITIPSSQGCANVGVFLECADCQSHISAIIKLGEDGIEVLESVKVSNEVRLLLSNLFLGVTREGKLSISCGVCLSEKVALELSRLPDGTYSLPENSQKHQEK